MKLFPAICIVLFLSFPLCAQSEDLESPAAEKINAVEETGSAREERKSPLKVVFSSSANGWDYARAVLETAGVNLAVHSFSSIVNQSSWANVSLETMKKNLTNPWRLWDDNTFFMNQMAHPYFGSLYFTSGRSNGLNFLASSILAAGGSFMWETFLEASAPSLPDFVTTTTAGMVTGEALYRLSMEASQISPVFLWLLSPMCGVTSILRGGRPTPAAGNIHSADIAFSGGMVTSAVSFPESPLAPSSSNKNSFGYTTKIVYGNPYAHNSKELFDQFFLRGDFYRGTNYEFSRLIIDGALYAFSIFDSYRPETTAALGFNYNYHRASDINFSAGSLGLALRQRIVFNWGEISWDSQLNYIFLGVTDNYFVLSGDSRVSLSKKQPAYSFRTGPEAKIAFALKNDSLVSIGLEASAQFLFSYPNSAQDSRIDGWSAIQWAELSVERRIYAPFSIGIADSFYHKYDHHTQIPCTDQIVNFVRLYIKLHLKPQ